ncbi:hypothetical protein VTJ83DRAFT_143 [Remersonia thermophila]|uniref:Uncharacterized protein n=1 Tax=Remersonia thermophila TaxID=72144 RepID=A0ABR4DKD1_9PEZI
MRPDRLPPLQIPHAYATRPVLLGNRRGTARRDQPIFFCPSSCSYLTYSPLPRLPPRQQLVDFDDIDVFKFYHPCVLPPSPFRIPCRQNIEPAALGDGAPNPPPPSRRDERSAEQEPGGSGGEQGDGSVGGPCSIADADPDAVASPSSAPPPPPPERRRPPLFDWDASSSVYPNPTDAEYRLHSGHSEREGPGGWGSMRSPPGCSPRTCGEPPLTHAEPGHAALAELWGVIDELLAERTHPPGDCDGTLCLAAGPWESAYLAEGPNGDEAHDRQSPGQATAPEPQQIPWWKLIREGLSPYESP